MLEFAATINHFGAAHTMETENRPEPATVTDKAVDSTGYRVQAGEFEGPLDLLLHLVRVNEVDLTDIPIVQITEQYNEYLALMKDMDLEVAGEYLVMAATLLHIKSQMLLPADPVSEQEAVEDDPRAQLSRQLLDYQKYKQATENLQAMDNRRSLIWIREDPVAEEFSGEELLTVDLLDLISSFKKLLGRMDEESRLRMKKDHASVADKITWLTDLLSESPSLSLQVLLETLEVRQEQIAAFLAILEMMRLQMIVVFQRKLAGEIRIARFEDVAPANEEKDS
jgi:segregation and condensation protein A